MNSTMERWYKAASQRFSTRKYSAGLTDAQLSELETHAASLSARGVRILLVRDVNAFRGLKGSRIKGTDTYAALISHDAKLETAGYIGEAFVLECTAMGIASCWLGASFSKGGVNAAVKLKDGEKLVCIICIGTGAEEYRARPRRTVSELTELSHEEYDALPEWKKDAILCARIAPSAINAQPWSFDPSGEGVTVENISNNFGWGRLDCGIAMLHTELGAAHNGVFGDWHENGVFNTFIPS